MSGARDSSVDATPSVDRTPSRRAVALAGGAAVLAAFPLALGGVAVLLGLAGAVGVTVGTVRGSRRGVTLGAGLGFVAVVLAGRSGAPPEALVVSLAGVVLAWDLGQHAVGVGQQLGRAATTWRLDLVHAGTSTLVVSATAGLAYLVFALGVGGASRGALALLLVAGAALTLALSPR